MQNKEFETSPVSWFLQCYTYNTEILQWDMGTHASPISNVPNGLIFRCAKLPVIENLASKCLETLSRPWKLQVQKPERSPRTLHASLPISRPRLSANSRFSWFRSNNKYYWATDLARTKDGWIGFTQASVWSDAR